MTKPTETPAPATPRPADSAKADQTKAKPTQASTKEGEIGGPKGPEPTRFGDWEQKGRCSDF